RGDDDREVGGARAGPCRFERDLRRAKERLGDGVLAARRRIGRFVRQLVRGGHVRERGGVAGDQRGELCYEPRRVAGKGALFGVDEIHRDLRLPVDLEAQGFDVTQSAGRVPQRLGDVLRDLDIGRRTEVHVVRDEKGARSNGDGPSRRVNTAGAEVGDASRILADLLPQSLELAAAYVGEVLAIGTRRRALVQENRNLQLPPDALA